jgi:proline iminopeptidase
MTTMNEETGSAALHPPTEPYDSGWLDAGEGHRLYYEQCGQPAGQPLLFLHGGPGSCCSPRHRRLFDPARHRLVLFDQRGCGRSRPLGGTAANTSAHLVADIERLRAHLGIARWQVVGGSWGAALALAYAAAHPAACSALVLRAPFLGRQSDLDWFFRDARQFAPQAWDQLQRQAPPAQRHDLLRWLHTGLQEDEAHAALPYAQAWQAWEAALAGEAAAAAPDPVALVARYRVQGHYLVHGCFWGTAPLLARAATLSSVPATILQGRLDLVCRPQAAWELHAALPGSRLLWLDHCGHSLFEPAMATALAKAVEDSA